MNIRINSQGTSLSIMEASSSSSLCDVDALEQELRLELERFEHLFDEDIEEASVSNLNISNSLNAFELAEAEGEKEFLQDKLALTLSKSEEQEKLLVEAEFKISNLAKRNLTLQEENDTLRHEMMQMSKLSYLQSLKEDQGGGQSPIADTSKPSAADYSALEYMLAETRSKLARAQQAHEDQILARELAEKELSHERLLRSHAEKERDAYSSAYEASLKHFERWSRKKQQQRQLTPTTTPGK